MALAPAKELGGGEMLDAPWLWTAPGMQRKPGLLTS
jgi:hypothetical protein